MTGVAPEVVRSGVWAGGGVGTSSWFRRFWTCVQTRAIATTTTSAMRTAARMASKVSCDSSMVRFDDS